MAVRRVTVGRLAGAAIAALLVLTGCSAPSASEPGAGISLTIGAQAGTTTEVLAQLYGQALAGEGYDVSYNYGVGSRAAYLAALGKGTLDVVPDFAGLVLAAVNPDSKAASIDDVDAALDLAFKPLGLTTYTPSPAGKPRAFVTTRAFATAHQLHSLSDLAPISTAITIGSTQDLGDGSYENDALAFSYDVSGFNGRTESDDATVIQDLLDGDVQVADVSTLEPGIKANDLVVLSDPAHIVVAQNVIPVVNAKAGSSHVKAVLDRVSAKLTSADLVAFAKDSEKLPAAVATAWLKREGIAGKR